MLLKAFLKLLHTYIHNLKSNIKFLWNILLLSYDYKKLLTSQCVKIRGPELTLI